MSSQQLASPRGNKRTLIIGFDFGTHSTKVVFRERGRADGHIVEFDDFATGYHRFVSPSLVRDVNGHLFFGCQALRQSGGHLFTSLKVGLLSDGPSCAPSQQSALECRTLIAAYCTWAFQQLSERLRVNSDVGVFVNVSAPMDHCENIALKEKYLQIVQASWKLAFANRALQIHQGISRKVVTSILTPLLQETTLASEYRRFEVLPETIAPVVSLSLDPLMKPGIYTIVDTGAGTTEISVFHAGDPGVDQKVLCYKDKMLVVGANDLQLAGDPESYRDNQHVNEITSRLVREYRRLWQLAYEVDAASPLSRDRWKDLTLVLSGGGTRHPALSRHLRGANPVPQWRGYTTSFEVCRHTPGTLVLASGMSDDDGSMFAVANGLAIERKKWPVVFEPHDIEPLTAPEPERAKEFWEEDRSRPRWV
jgi:hypothetical protein